MNEEENHIKIKSSKRISRESIITSDGKECVDISDLANKSKTLYYALNRTVLGKNKTELDIKLKICNAVITPTQFCTVVRTG